MKYGMHSCGLKSYSVKEAIKKVGEFGYDGFEIDVFPLAKDRPAWEKYRNRLIKEIPEINKIGKDVGIEINSLCLGVLWFINIAGEDEEETDLGISIIKDCIEIGSKLGASCLLLPIGQPEEVSPEKARDNLYHSLMMCIEEAEEYNIVLAVENVVQRVLWSSKDLIELVDRVDSTFCRVYYDVGNPYFAQIKPAEEIIQLNKRIFQFHVKDMQEEEVVPDKREAEIGNESATETIPFRGDTDNWKGKRDATIGTGIVDWPSILTAIRDIGFDRYLVTEITQDAERPDMIAKENITALKELGKRIQMSGDQ